MSSMYAKLMSRITESSLMEEDVPVRYCFMMMLAIADPQGYVIGTDIAIARRMNLPVSEFKEYVAELMQPDPDSNSHEQEGRRVVVSDSERGYYVVNYRKYRDTRDEESRRDYMRKYMQERRAALTGGKPARKPREAGVNGSKRRKPQLANAEVEEDAEGKAEGDALPPGSAVSEEGLRFADWFKTLLPSDAKQSENWQEQWAGCFDEMLRLDSRTSKQIAAVCKWARQDEFWKGNFLTPLKLRQRKAAGHPQYFDVFAERMKTPAKNDGASARHARKEASQYGIEPGTTPTFDPMAATATET